MLSRMELEARSAAPNSAARGRALTAKVASYRTDAAALAKRVREASASSNNNAGDLARAELGLGGGAARGASASSFGGGGGGLGAGPSSDRDRVLAAGERIERSGERIAQGRAQLLQTEVRVCSFSCFGEGGREAKAGFPRWREKKTCASAHAEPVEKKKKKPRKKKGPRSLDPRVSGGAEGLNRAVPRAASRDRRLARGGQPRPQEDECLVPLAREARLGKREFSTLFFSSKEKNRRKLNPRSPVP